MAAEVKWSSLPSIIIAEIFSYLSTTDRTRAASVCTRWRTCLFHPLLWKQVNLNVTKRQGCRFLADSCAGYVQKTSVIFNSHNANQVREFYRILNILSHNRNLKALTIKPTSCHIEWPTRQSECNIANLLKMVESIVRTSRSLCHLSMGCLEEPLEKADKLITLLGHFQGDNLKSLHLASVKEYPNNYNCPVINPQCFSKFSCLQNLSLDYDFLSSDLLSCFSNNSSNKNSSSTLKHLVLHVHGVYPEHDRIPNSAWLTFSESCPQLELTLNLIHSDEGVPALLDILQPSMPLTHFRQFFCSHINVAAITYLGRHYSNTLCTLHIVDAMFGTYPAVYLTDQNENDEDPFVMLAWRCPNLSHFTLIGYEIADHDVVAIARLRGSKLVTFDIPLICIAYLWEEEAGEWLTQHGMVDDEFIDKISSSLGWSWRPLDAEELHPAVLEDEVDAESAYMDMLLNDQAWE